jgi:tetratricopeptide (TPR) repeat protein
LNEQLEAAEKVPDVNRRDELVVAAILNAGAAESLDHLLYAADKIADANLRAQLLDWVYFNRAQEAIKGKRLDEAMRSASKVKEMDQRAYLYSEIAREAFQKIENQQQARDLLEDIITTASKGPNTIVTARALLAATYLYLKIDPARAISVLAEAVKAINRIESPDFSRQFVMRRIEGKTFARYASFRTPGFDPENAFREMAKINFDDALSQVSAFTDKGLRSLTTLVLAESCLQRADQKERIEKAKKKTKLP